MSHQVSMSAVPDSRNICACLFVSVLCPSEQKFLLGLHPSCACLSVSVSCPNRLSSFTGTCCSESVNLHSSLVLCANKPVFGQAPVFSPASNHHVIVDSSRRHCVTSPIRRVVNTPSRRHVVNTSLVLELVSLAKLASLASRLLASKLVSRIASASPLPVAPPMARIASASSSSRLGLVELYRASWLCTKLPWRESRPLVERATRTPTSRNT